MCFTMLKKSLQRFTAFILLVCNSPRASSFLSVILVLVTIFYVPEEKKEDVGVRLQGHRRRLEDVYGALRKEGEEEDGWMTAAKSLGDLETYMRGATPTKKITNEEHTDKEWREVQLLRVGRARAACARRNDRDGVPMELKPGGARLFGDEPPPDVWTRLHWSQRHNFVYCANAKTGTTAMTQVLFQSSMIKDTFNLKEWLPDAREKLRSLFSFPDSLSVGDRLRAVNRSLSFTFVRHPFVRLISAFQNKVVDTKGSYKSMSYRVANNFTGALEKPVPWPGVPTFPNFVKFLVNVGGAKRDVHFRPQANLCCHCTVPYDVIIKLESIDRDCRYLWEALGKKEELSDLLNLFSKPKVGSDQHEGGGGTTEAEQPVSKKTWLNQVSSGGRTQKLAEEYFSTISKAAVLELYEYYKLDFKAFGYEFKSYLKLAKD